MSRTICARQVFLYANKELLIKKAIAALEGGDFSITSYGMDWRVEFSEHTLDECAVVLSEYISPEFRPFAVLFAKSSRTVGSILLDIYDGTLQPTGER